MIVQVSIRHFIFCTVVSLMLLSPVTGATGKYPIKNFTTSEYKGGIQNIDFAQNRDMSLFVANNLGILSFNGTEWGKHAFNTGKKQRSLVFDENSNRLYVGMQSDFGYFEQDWEYVSLIDRIPDQSRDFDEVWDVYLHNSKVYFCTFQGIYVFDGQSITVLDHKEGLNRSFFTGNDLFTQSASGQLLEVNEAGLSVVEHQGRSNQIVAGVIATSDGYLLFYNSGEIELSSAFDVSDVFPNLMTVLAGKYVNHVKQLSDSRLVISTQRAGIYLFDMTSGLIENISTDDGLLSNACLRAFQDHSGNLWIGMQNGIALVDINSPMRLINREINLQGSGYEAYDMDNGTYYTTSNGIFYLPEGIHSAAFLDGTEGPAYGMQMIDDKLYASHHTGLFILEGGKARRCAFTDGLWQIKQLRSNPNYAIGGTYSGLHLFRLNDKDELESVGQIEGFSESSRFFEEDREGSIWVGQFYKGLYKLNLDNSLKTAQVSKVSDLYNDLPINEYVFLSRIEDDLYLGTKQGVYKIDQARDTIVEAELFSKTIGKDWVYLLAQDKQKNVHVYTQNLVGFFKQVGPNNFAYVPSSLFQLKQSFNNDLLSVSVHVKEGVLFDANEGFIRYNPALEDRLTIENKPIINRIFNIAEDSVLYGRKPFEGKSATMEPISITQGTRVLQFEVESFKFRDVNNQQFRYFLKGFDDEYGEWTNTTIKEYTNLKEGNYEFLVQTFNYLGEVVTSDPIRVEVNPPFFKSLPAKIIYTILIVFFLFLTYRFQRGYYKGKHSKIEKAKQEELVETQKEVQALKEEQTQTELRHVNNLLAASTMNLVVKNEFMENIKEEIKEVMVNGKSSDTQKALERIIKEIDTTLKVQEDWKQFEYHFDRVHGDFLTRLTNEFLDLTPGEQKLCAFLRLKMDTKEIANLMGVSLRGVEVARYRLRKKLRLENYQNLSKFILEY
ncbi:MAG: triple tyrosine motif-containing protein [Bacteroidota bacterium]